MSIRDSVSASILEALKEKNELKLRVLRLLLGEIKMKDAEKGVKVDDAVAIQLVQKEIKIREDSILDSEKSGNADQVYVFRDEIALLTSYLPKQLSDLELEGIIKDTALEIGASNVSDMGRLMKAVLTKISGQASNQTISKIVQKVLKDQA